LIGMPERERSLGALDLAVSVAQQDYEYIRKKYEESGIEQANQVLPRRPRLPDRPREFDRTCAVRRVSQSARAHR
jgi:hypothetical protein